MEINGHSVFMNSNQHPECSKCNRVRQSERDFASFACPASGGHDLRFDRDRDKYECSKCHRVASDKRDIENTYCPG